MLFGPGDNGNDRLKAAEIAKIKQGKRMSEFMPRRQVSLSKQTLAHKFTQ